jgi:hypothetical protein
MKFRVFCWCLQTGEVKIDKFKINFVSVPLADGQGRLKGRPPRKPPESEAAPKA